MTCKACNYVNESYAERCVGCGNLLNEKTAPKTKIADTQNISPIDEALKDIKNASVAGVVSGFLTLAVTLYAMLGYKYLSFDAFSLIDVAFTFGLAFGIYKKNRACAIVMLVYFLLSKYMILSESGSLSSIPLSLVFIYYYYKGLIGTFNYQKIKNS